MSRWPQGDDQWHSLLGRGGIEGVNLQEKFCSLDFPSDAGVGLIPS